MSSVPNGSEYGFRTPVSERPLPFPTIPTSAVSGSLRFEIFDVEERGDTLVVTPLGDPAGYPLAQYRTELRGLVCRLDRCRVRNLVVDLSAAGYHGVGVTTTLDEVIRGVLECGGRVAVVAGSSDTMTGLRIHGFDDRWPIYPNRRAAVATIATEPFPCRLRRLGRRAVEPASVVAAVLFGVFGFHALVAGAAEALSGRSPEEQVARELAEVRGALTEIRRADAGRRYVPGWNRLVGRAAEARAELRRLQESGRPVDAALTAEADRLVRETSRPR